jgi:Flp pilus assembly protein TadG
MIRQPNFIKKPEGVAATTVAITLFVLIGAASLVIDMGQLYTVRHELQEVADAAALAGVAQLIEDQGGQAVRNSNQAIQAAMAVTLVQSKLRGLPPVGDEIRNDLTIHFGVWDIYAADRSQAWTDLGTNCASDSNANALRTTIRRTSGTKFGPVTNLFAKVFGFPNSEASATATAYLGFITTPQKVRVTVPLKVPTDQGAVSFPGQVSGGPDNQNIIFGAQPSAGAIAMMPRLVK